MLALFNRSYCRFPVIKLAQIRSLAKATSGKTYKCRVHILKSLIQIGTKSNILPFVRTVAVAAFRNERNKVYKDFTLTVKNEL